MKRTRINPISTKQREKNKHWNEVTDERCRELNYICQWCGEVGQRRDRERWDFLDGHHIIKRRYNIHTKGNCYICHRVPCHRMIDDNNIDVTVCEIERELR